MESDTTILFSKSCMCAKINPLPSNFIEIANEAELSYQKGDKTTHGILKKIINENMQRHKDKHNLVVITGLYGDYYAFNRGLFGRSYPPFILTEIEWNWRYRRKITLRGVLNKLFHQYVAKGASYVTVYCKAEISNYSNAYEIPPEKFIWLPYCSALDENKSPHNGKEEYILTGGLNDRDYPTLFSAIRDLPIQFRLVAHKESLKNYNVPSNVELIGILSKADYYQEISKAKAIVLSVDTTSHNASLRYAGITAYVSSMRMRKCVIVNDPIGASSYITNGKHGLLPPPNEPEALRETILQVWEDNNLRKILANNAYERSHKEFGYHRYFSDLQKYAKLAIKMARA